MLFAVAVAMALAAPAPASALTPQAAAAGTPAERYLQSLAPPPQSASQPLDDVGQRLAKQLADRFGVRVLRAEPVDDNGRTLYRVVVMAPGGNRDNAYAVRTLMVDAETGALVPQFQHEASGYTLAEPADRSPRDDGVATTLRRESFGKP